MADGDNRIMLVYLSFIACTLSGAQCYSTVPLGAEAGVVGLAACQVAGMQQAAIWTEQHPGWHVTKIRCSMGSHPHAEDGA